MANRPDVLVYMGPSLTYLFGRFAMYFDCKVSAPRGGTTEKFSKLLPKNWDPHTLGSLNSGSNTTSNASNHQPSFPPDSCYPKAPIAARKKTKRIQKLWNVAINALFLSPTRFLMVSSQYFWLGKFLGIRFWCTSLGKKMHQPVQNCCPIVAIERILSANAVDVAEIVRLTRYPNELLGAKNYPIISRQKSSFSSFREASSFIRTTARIMKHVS